MLNWKGGSIPQRNLVTRKGSGHDGETGMEREKQHHEDIEGYERSFPGVVVKQYVEELSAVDARIFRAYSIQEPRSTIEQFILR